MLIALIVLRFSGSALMYEDFKFRVFSYYFMFLGSLEKLEHLTSHFHFAHILPSHLDQLLCLPAFNGNGNWNETGKSREQGIQLGEIHSFFSPLSLFPIPFLIPSPIPSLPKKPSIQMRSSPSFSHLQPPLPLQIPPPPKNPLIHSFLSSIFRLPSLYVMHVYICMWVCTHRFAPYTACRRWRMGKGEKGIGRGEGGM